MGELSIWRCVRREPGKHAARYWAEKLQEGIVVAFGPVADPKGAWGVGIVRAKEVAGVEAMCDADPAMLADIGMRYEILPMMAAVY